MVSLVYYTTEKIEFKEAFDKTLTILEATIVYGKLCRHFKIPTVSLEWTSGCVHPKCSYYRILLNRDWNNFGVLCHEVAHLFQFRKLEKHGHNKQHKKLMKRMIRYCEKMNWFSNELLRRTTLKPITQPSDEELRLQKIVRLEDGIKRHQKKVRRLETLIKKNERRIVHLKRFVNEEALKRRE